MSGSAYPGKDDGELYRCSRCRETVPVEESDEHDERCPPGVDWRAGQ